LLPGVPRRVSGFVAVLPYSRMLYVEFVLSQRFGSFVRCMERAAAFFGGTAHVDVFDGMKTVVLGREGGAPRLHSGFVEYARVRGFAITVCTPRKPPEGQRRARRRLRPHAVHARPSSHEPARSESPGH
jgi:transposase